jgi:hypothetical protein
MMPEWNLQLLYKGNRKDKEVEWLLGAGVDFLVLKPRLSTEVTVRDAYDTVINNTVMHVDAITKQYKTDAATSAVTVNVLAKLMTKRITLKMAGIYGQNCYAFNLLGGYAVKSITDPVKGTEEYAPVTTGTVWLDVRTNGTRWQPGIFGGFAKNLGTGVEVTGPFYSRGATIDYLYRISPRIAFQAKKLKIAAELEYTVAAYGTTTGKGLVSSPHEVGNVRALVGVTYFF